MRLALPGRLPESMTKCSFLQAVRILTGQFGSKARNGMRTFGAYLWDQDGGEWIKAGKLKHPLAYAAVVSSKLGVIAMGGNDSATIYDKVWLLRWDSEKKAVHQEALPALPSPCAYGSAAMIGNVVYLAGGTEGRELHSAMNNFWVLDLDKYGTDDFQWEVLPPWPGSCTCIQT